MTKIVPLTVVLTLALVGCGGQLRPLSTQSPTSRTTGPTPAGSTSSGQVASPGHELTRSICERLDFLVSTQQVDELRAIGDLDNQGRTLRLKVAQSYVDFTERLSLLAGQAEGELRDALADWALAGSEVALHVAKKPGRDIVLDYGPPLKRLTAAQKATEKICGRKIPNTGK
jgi:hypothetical protein